MNTLIADLRWNSLCKLLCDNFWSHFGVKGETTCGDD